MSELRTNKIYPRDGLPAGASGGGIIQVVQGTYSTATTINTATYTDTGLSASITPTSSSNKIIVTVSQQATIYSSAAQEQGAGIKLFRGSTEIYTIDDSGRGGLHINGSGVVEHGGLCTFTYIDSPATTSSTTYKVQMALYTTSNSASISAQKSSTASSSIILMEVSG